MIAAQAEVTPQVVGHWRRRWQQHGLAGLYDAPRAGPPRTYDDDRVASLLRTVLQSTPADGGTHWSVRKVRDIVGLYLSPPAKALVLCVDEKSQIQALERTQPMLPLGLGYVEGVTHGYVRHGTTTVFAALDVATGRVLVQCKPRHRHQEFLAFLQHIDANVSAELIARIEHFVEHYNVTTPFRWTATAESILAKIERLATITRGTSH